MRKRRAVGSMRRSFINPLLTHPVANSLYAEGGILLTGSNASGKSTFMKNMAVNAILAQALNTSLSKRYRGVVCRIMTSMALRDNLAQGESYFVVEVKSLKRILEASREKTPLLCVIDEVLRGTNTTERIAASEMCACCPAPCKCALSCSNT